MKERLVKHFVSLVVMVGLMAGFAVSCEKWTVITPVSPVVTIDSNVTDEGRHEVLFFFTERTVAETVLSLDVYCVEGFPVMGASTILIPKGKNKVTMNVNLNNQFDPGVYHVVFRLIGATGNCRVGTPSETTIEIVNEGTEWEKGLEFGPEL